MDGKNRQDEIKTLRKNLNSAILTLQVVRTVAALDLKEGRYTRPENVVRIIEKTLDGIKDGWTRR